MQRNDGRRETAVAWTSGKARFLDSALEWSWNPDILAAKATHWVESCHPSVEISACCGSFPHSYQQSFLISVNFIPWFIDWEAAMQRKDGTNLPNHQHSNVEGRERRGWFYPLHTVAPPPAIKPYGAWPVTPWINFLGQERTAVGGNSCDPCICGSQDPNY